MAVKINNSSHNKDYYNKICMRQPRTEMVLYPIMNVSRTLCRAIVEQEMSAKDKMAKKKYVGLCR